MSTIKKKITLFASGTMLVVLILGFVVGCSGEAPAAEGTYVPGTYTGEGNGMAGTIEVTLTVDGDAIVSVDGIEDSGETKGIGGKEAIDDGTYADQIMQAQSAELDGIAGATITTGGVEQAVENALAEARNN